MRLATLPLLLLALSGCRKEPPPTRTVYTVQGVVKDIRAGQRQVVIQHDAIPNFMDSMTMPFAVKNVNVLSGIRAGDKVHFQLVIQGEEAFIESIATQSQVERPKRRPADNADLVRLPRVGDEIPDIVLTNEEGRRVRLKEYRGRVLALNFIFTRCPLPTYCPRTMREFKSLKAKLGDRFGKDVAFFTFTFDPKHDKPETLKSYRKSYQIDPRHWQFLTGNPEEVKKAVSFFGLNYWTTESGNISEHTMSTVLVDRQGRIARFYPGNEVPADRVFADIELLLQ